ncbi:unnamed protein product [Cochlearia groenlandica]
MSALFTGIKDWIKKLSPPPPQISSIDAMETKSSDMQGSDEFKEALDSQIPEEPRDPVSKSEKEKIQEKSKSREKIKKKKRVEKPKQHQRRRQPPGWSLWCQRSSENIKRGKRKPPQH